MKILILLLLSTSAFAMDRNEERRLMKKCAEGEFASGSELGKFCQGLQDNKAFFVINLKRSLKKNKELREKFNDENPDLDANLDSKAMKFKVDMAMKDSEDEIANWDAICKREKNSLLFCLSDEEKARRKNIAEREACLYRRSYQAYTLDKANAQKNLFELGEIKWDPSLPSPKNCNSILESDKKFIKKANPNAVEHESCEWSKDLPREIITVPGCSSGKSNQVCSGYVICEKGSKKSIKRASCSVESCGDSKDNAQSCVGEKGYSSKAAGKSVGGVSKKVEKALTGAAQQ